MAPEQIQGASATPALDVFALGSVAYFAATGRPAFGEGDAMGVIYRIVEQMPDLAALPSELRDLIASCMAKDPAARPTPAAVLAASLPSGGAAGAAPWLPPAVAAAAAARTAGVTAIAARPRPATAVAPTGGGRTTGAPRVVRAMPPTRRGRRVLGALALGVVVLAGVVFGINKLNKSAASAGGPSSSPAATSPSAALSSATLSPTPSSKPTADLVRWTGSVNLTFVGLDTVPPTVYDTNDKATFWVNYINSDPRNGAVLYGSNGGFFTSNANLALWSAAGEPTRQQCADQVATQASDTLPLAKGSRYCISTPQHRIAFLVVGAFDDANQAYQGMVKVWSATT
jgi:hypothetical protein